MIKDERGQIVEVHATYDPATRGGDSPDGRKVKSTIHWLSAPHAVEAEIRMYDRLFTKEDPEEGEEDYLNAINPNSMRVLTGYVEPLLGTTKPGDRFQFERQGYFCTDPDSSEAKPVFNLTVLLKDTWAKIANSNKQ
jgi:glutaminyl-tRNA synthetase